MQSIEKKKPNKINTVLGAGIVILMIVGMSILLWTCLFSGDSASPTTETSTPKAYLVKGTPIASYTEFGNLIIEGIVENRGNKEATFVEAEATFYDSNKNILGKYSDYFSQLGTGQSWRYSIMYLGLDEGDVGSFSVDVTYR